jgi:hypothetical protein
MIQLLSKVFPPRLPTIPEAIEKFTGREDEIIESGVVAVYAKPYKNGIHRVRAEKLTDEIEEFAQWQGDTYVG